MTVSLAAFMAIAATTIVRARRRTLAFAGAYGAGGVTLPPPGTPGVVRAAIDGVGIVYAAGEDWSARCVDGCILPQGAPVRVVGQEGLMLIVEPATEA